MTVKTVEIELAARQLHQAMEKVPTQIIRLTKEIELCDQETSDLLHLIELSKFHASEGYRLCRDLQITRQKRRQCKDELESLKQLDERLKKNRPITQQTSLIESIVHNRKSVFKNRTYKPRVRSDLIERFSKL